MGQIVHRDISRVVDPWKNRIRMANRTHSDMNIKTRSLSILALMAGLFCLSSAPATAAADPARDKALAQTILNDANLTVVLEKGKNLLKSGLNAGSGYGEVWIRDLNTFIELSLQVNDPKPIREALLTFFKFQGAGGDIVDGYIPKEKGSTAYKYRKSGLAPNLLAHKNTVETDQESSLIQAVRKYIQATGDQALLAEVVDGATVAARMEQALEFLLSQRFDAQHGLIWGATTADWGDVQPEHDWGVELDENSHRSLDIYDNAMLVIAIGDLVQMRAGQAATVAKWEGIARQLRHNIRQHLWDGKRGKFIPHVYLNGSPFPPGFEEADVYYHGGTTIAMEAGLLSPAEVADSLAQMRRNVRQSGAGSIGLTLYPPYPKGSFKNRSMGPYSYQNGGDWDWFGGRTIQQLIRAGLLEEAYQELKPMVARIVRANGFHEWWSLDNQPKGSGQFRGAAGVLGLAIEQLQSWARKTAAGA